jgi:hypothetical protein
MERTEEANELLRLDVRGCELILRPTTVGPVTLWKTIRALVRQGAMPSASPAATHHSCAPTLSCLCGSRGRRKATHST